MEGLLSTWPTLSSLNLILLFCCSSRCLWASDYNIIHTISGLPVQNSKDNNFRNDCIYLCTFLYRRFSSFHSNISLDSATAQCETRVMIDSSDLTRVYCLWEAGKYDLLGLDESTQLFPIWIFTTYSLFCSSLGFQIYFRI